MTHNVTIRAIARRDIPQRTLARLLDCTEDHVGDLLSGGVPPTGRELAILRLVANVVATRLATILDDFETDGEWRTIPGFENYEITREGHVRRAAGGHGSQAGSVLKSRDMGTGYRAVNLSQGGEAKTMMVHVLVCMTFNGPKPSPAHLVCHKNDVRTDNRSENLYWGLPADNAADRQRNAPEKFDTFLTHAANSGVHLTRLQKRKIAQYQMDKRLAKMRGGA